MSNNNSLPILVIIGPSGSGKSTIIKKLFDDNIIIINPTWTTRPPRIGEAEFGIEHYFASKKEFKEKQADNFFLETVEMFNLPFIYGLPQLKESTNNKVSLVMLRASLLPLFQKYYSNYFIYQIEDSLVNVKKRLAERQEKGENMGSRLADFEKEVELGRKVANRVFVNTKLSKLYEEIQQAIKEDYKL